MSNFEALYARWIVNHRITVIVLSLILVGAFGSGLPSLYFDSSYRAFFGKDNPQLIAFETLENTYTKNDNVIIVLAPRDGDVFTPGTLSAIESLTTESWQVPYSNRVDSITNFQYTEAIEDDLIVRDMVKNGADLGAAELADLGRKILGPDHAGGDGVLEVVAHVRDPIGPAHDLAFRGGGRGP